MDKSRTKAKTKTGAKPAHLVYILSDSTGNLARHMLTAFLTQFPSASFTLKWKPFLQTPQKLADALAEIARDPGIVFHAMVSRDVKRQINDWCAEHDMPSCDLTGSFVDFLAQHSGLTPSQDTNRLHGIDESYLARIRAMEYTLEHDDGLGLETVHHADLVLAGVSRTSKTPTSIYLAQQGFKVANVSLAMGVDPPAELFALPRNRVVGLLIHPEKLADIRTKRNRGWQMGDTAYNDPEMIHEELTWVRRLFQKQGWQTLDITDYAIEESAARILDMLQLQTPTLGPAGGVK